MVLSFLKRANEQKCQHFSECIRVNDQIKHFKRKIQNPPEGVDVRGNGAKSHAVQLGSLYQELGEENCPQE